MNDTRNKISLLAAQGVISKEMREILYALCDAIDAINAPIAPMFAEPDPEQIRGRIEPEDTGSGVRELEPDPNRENSLDIEQPSLRNSRE